MKSTLTVLTISLGLLGSTGIAISGNTNAQYGSADRGARQLDVAPVDNLLYLEECGACHFAYQPGLLPARSWSKMMATLDNHFGENAELPEDTAKALEAYLLANSADDAPYKRSRRIFKSIASSDAPLRISETPYFVKEHDELSAKMVQDNPEVGSLSKCNACHTQAEKGSYEENEILIPGYGPWEDD